MENSITLKTSLFHKIQRHFKDSKDLHSNSKTFKDFKDPLRTLMIEK